MKKTKYYLSSHFLESGAFFAKVALGYENNEKYINEDYKYILPSGIIIIVSFLESYINEFYSEIVDIKSSTTRIINNMDIIVNLWKRDIPRTARFSILDKYEILLDLTNNKQFDKSKNPYQDVSALIKLRNSLVHYDPDWQDVYENDTNSKLKKLLKDRYKLCPYYNKDETPFFPYLCLSADCLSWAMKCSTDLVINFNQNTNCSIPLISIFNNTVKSQT